MTARIECSSCTERYHLSWFDLKRNYSLAGVVSKSSYRVMVCVLIVFGDSPIDTSSKIMLAGLTSTSYGCVIGFYMFFHLCRWLHLPHLSRYACAKQLTPPQTQTHTGRGSGLSTTSIIRFEPIEVWPSTGTLFQDNPTHASTNYSAPARKLQHVLESFPAELYLSNSERWLLPKPSTSNSLV